jgi:hypothetical protein
MTVSRSSEDPALIITPEIHQVQLSTKVDFENQRLDRLFVNLV